MLRPFSKEKLIAKSNNDIPTTSNSSTLNFKPLFYQSSSSSTSMWYEAPRHDDPALYTALFKRKFVKVFALPKSWETSSRKRRTKFNSTSEESTILTPTEHLASSVPSSTSLCTTKTKAKGSSTLFLTKLPQDLTRSLSNQLSNLTLDKIINKENLQKDKELNDLIPLSPHSLNSISSTTSLQQSPCLQNCLECDDKVSKNVNIK